MKPVEEHNILFLECNYYFNCQYEVESDEDKKILKAKFDTLYHLIEHLELEDEFMEWIEAHANLV